MASGPDFIICDVFDLQQLGGSRGVGTGGQDPAGKSQVAIGFLRKPGTDPLGSNCFSNEVCTALCEICYWLKNVFVNAPLAEFT